MGSRLVDTIPSLRFFSLIHFETAYIFRFSLFSFIVSYICLCIHYMHGTFILCIRDAAMMMIRVMMHMRL